LNISVNSVVRNNWTFEWSVLWWKTAEMYKTGCHLNGT